MLDNAIPRASPCLYASAAVPILKRFLQLHMVLQEWQAQLQHGGPVDALPLKDQRCRSNNGGRTLAQALPRVLRRCTRRAGMGRWWR